MLEEASATAAELLDNARRYYGEALGGTADLRTNACATVEAPAPAVRTALGRVHPEVRARYYGCGLVAPEAIAGMRVLDLGCGAGQDAFVLAQLVGERGEVVGVDATPTQLEIAQRWRDWHAAEAGFARPNTHFVAGDIARLCDLGLEPGSFDLIVSNCVINLVADKPAVFRAAHALLKPGGEMYFADVYADRRVPAALLADTVLHGECLAGALYWGDFLAAAKAAGFGDPRLASDRPITITDAAIAAKLEGIGFWSATWRLFRLDGLEPECEDYGQAVVYRGTIPGHEARLRLDKHHDIEAGRAFPVCGNTWRMLGESRFAPHFTFIGDFSRHYGVFPGCGGGCPFDPAGATGATGASATPGCC
jgi:arsenite methyltransferase